MRATAASVADITQLPELLHGQEREVFGDHAYWKEADREFLERATSLIAWLRPRFLRHRHVYRREFRLVQEMAERVILFSFQHGLVHGCFSRLTI